MREVIGEPLLELKPEIISEELPVTLLDLALQLDPHNYNKYFLHLNVIND